ncbi:MAG TPA: Ku protein [Blastocatellia bacterium]|nr:Ku protein [Blastocatellia bacterium]
MAARSIWKAELKLGGTRIPVNLYSAVIDRTVHFNILEEKTKSRVKQHMVDPSTGEEVPSEAIRKGYEVEPGTFVILTDEELESLEPDPSREIEITHFVPSTRIEPEWYERPYYLGPDGNTSAYFALAEALNKQHREGVARWIMRKKEYIGALRAEGDYLLLVTMRHAEEVVSIEDLPTPAGREPDKKELGMATQLVEALAGEFDPSEFKDEYRERLMEFVESKARGKTTRLHALKAKRAPTSLTSALERSLKALKKEKAAA